MVYILTIKKHYKQKGIHPSLAVIGSYINLFGKNDFLICWPGYLSTNVKSANNFFQKFPIPLFKGMKNRSNHCFFFKGMNGNRNIIGLPSKTISEYINDLYDAYTCSYGTNDDHSKIVAFCKVDSKNVPPRGSSIDSIINEIIDGRIVVKALLIGSSNHSHNTLTKISPHKKGECDVFIFEEESCGDDERATNLYNKVLEEIRSSRNEQISLFLTKEICHTSSLNDIFKGLVKEPSK